MRLPAALLAVALSVAACGDDGAPATTAAPTTTSDPLELLGCDDVDPTAGFVLDVDGDGEDDRVVIVERSASSLLLTCPDAGLQFEVDGGGAEPAGALDLTGDGVSELLVTKPTRRGVRVVALEGRALIDLPAERWSDLGEADAPPFEGASYQCTDWGADGALDLVARRYRPAATGEVTVTAALVALDGGAPVRVEVDSQVVGVDEAQALWSAPDGCGADG